MDYNAWQGHFCSKSFVDIRPAVSLCLLWFIHCTTQPCILRFEVRCNNVQESTPLKWTIMIKTIGCDAAIMSRISLCSLYCLWKWTSICLSLNKLNFNTLLSNNNCDWYARAQFSLQPRGNHNVYQWSAEAETPPLIQASNIYEGIPFRPLLSIFTYFKEPFIQHCSTNPYRKVQSAEQDT